jgi:NADPH:quinone reductase-like Zn-dependent oxidoreductase
VELRHLKCFVAVPWTAYLGRAAQLRQHPPPYIPGVDAAGIVDKPGPGSDGRLAPGDQVSAFVVPLGPRGGSYAEYIVVPEASVVPAPKGASVWEAATLFLNAATARLACVDAPSWTFPNHSGRSSA